MDNQPVVSTSEMMFRIGERNVKNDFSFNWGLKTEIQNEKGYQFYTSFFCNGLEYFLYDCVYIYHRGDSETTIGNLVEMFETESHERKVKVVRFFRPSELSNFFRVDEPRWNEIFLASGKGAGVSKCYFLEEVIKKCNVVCTLNDERNPQPSQAKLGLADYIFYRTYDVKKCMILKDFPDKIHQIPVKFFFNTEQDARRTNSDHQKDLGEFGGNSSLLPRQEINYGSKGQRACSDNDKNNSRVSVLKKNSSATHLEISPCKKMKVLLDGNGENSGPVKGAYNVKASETSKRAPPHLKPIEDTRSSKSTQHLEVTKKPIIDKSKWFKQQPWEQRLRRAQEAATLILLENLDSTFSSSEVEELVQNALKQKVDVKMLQCTSTCDPYCGKALVIFESNAAAERALSDLDKRCLMLSDGSGYRPVVGSRGFLADPSKRVKFVGHLTLPKSLHNKHTKEMENAISTSHCAQANAIEYDMAMEWRLLQEWSDLCWKKLHESQKEEILKLKRELKIKEKEF